jgi:hypothetical protein
MASSRDKQSQRAKRQWKRRQPGYLCQNGQEEHGISHYSDCLMECDYDEALRVCKYLVSIMISNKQGAV